jgi:hypothetical protein
MVFPVGLLKVLISVEKDIYALDAGSLEDIGKGTFPALVSLQPYLLAEDSAVV